MSIQCPTALRMVSRTATSTLPGSYSSQWAVMYSYLAFHAAHGSQLALHRDVAHAVAVIHHFLGLADILLEGLLGGIDHDVGVAGVGALIAVIDRSTVIQVQADGDG